MATVREVVLDLLRELKVTTIFGNPGSTELPMLEDFPDDFRYVLAVQEASALGIAEGYARTSGNAAFVNLHTAPGLGNAMGAMVTAFHNRTPLIVTAGQQHRDHIATEPLLKGDLVELAKPYVKRSFEPYRAEDVPREILRAYHTAMTAPQGPVFLSIPMDDWYAEAEPVHATRVSYTVAPDPDAIASAARTIGSASNPAIVVGPGVARSPDGFRHIVALAEKMNAPVFQEGVVALAGFPQSHPLFHGFLPLAQKPISDRLAPFDAVLVVGTRVFTYYPHIPGPVVKDGTEIVLLTDDAEEASLSPLGESVVGDVGRSAKALLDALPETERSAPDAPEPPPEPEATTPMSVVFVMKTLADVMPDDVIVSDESTSSKAVLHKYVKSDDAKGYLTSEAGGLGFCMPAAVGAKLALPERPVVCVIGDGSSLYSIQSLWTAARYEVPVVFVIVDNRGYAILKSFRNLLGMKDVPGLDLPGVDHVEIAQGFGVDGETVEVPEDLAPALERAFSYGKPYLLRVVVGDDVPSLV